MSFSEQKEMPQQLSVRAWGPIWFRAVGFLVAMGLILLWWLWASTLVEHLVVAAAFFGFLTFAKWAGIKLGYLRRK